MIQMGIGNALQVVRAALRGRLLYFCLALMALPSIAMAQAGERITDYRVAISVNTDRTVEITETIEINVLGRTFKRGLLRDIPVRYQALDDVPVYINLDVKSVKRNGKEEPYELTHDGRYARLRIGDANVFLTHTRHTYEIRYTVDDSIGFFDEFDEIYWNAIGTEWPFGIDAATVSVLLPEGGRVTQYSVYTGLAGRRGKDYRIVGETDRSITFASTRIFSPGEGMSIAVGWQKGLIEEPTESEKLLGKIMDNSPIAILLLFGIGQFGWLYSAWTRVGKDPEGGAIFPRYRAPKDLSPAVSSYVSGLGQFAKNEQASFMAAIVNLAIKGFVTIDNESVNLTIERNKNDDKATDELPAGEKALMAKLFSSYETATFASMTHSTMSGIMQAFRSAVDDETDSVYFRRNTSYLVPGILLALVGLVGYILASIFLAPPFTLPLIEIIIAAVLVGILYAFYALWRVFKGRARMKSALFIPFFMVMMFGTAVMSELENAGGAFLSIGIVSALIIAIMVLSLFLFSHLMKAPTKLGREVMDEVEGLKMFMTVTVAQQASEVAKDMPELTPKLYEDLLPFGIALGIEKQWSDTFEDKVFSQLPPDQAYHPHWYRGHFNAAHPTQSFASMTETLGTDLKSAMTPPASSSSGSGGGGSSGGGGGGGGGGGW